MSALIHKIPISPKKDFLERQASASSINALAELIWNGLDSGSNLIDVSLTSNDMGGLTRIEVSDEGTGIPHDDIETLFGDLGNSWKKTKGRINGRALHGKNGEGRFKAFALGDRVRWKTNYESNGEVFSYEISGRASALDGLTYTDPVSHAIGKPGTEVCVDEISKPHGTLLNEDTPHELARLFAPFLKQYPSVKIYLNGEEIDPALIQEHTREIMLESIQLGDGKAVDVTVSIVEWGIKTKRAIHLCDGDGVSLFETEAGIQAPGFQFTAYVRCDHFRELDKENSLELEELHPEVKAILGRSKEAIRGHFRRRRAEQAQGIVARWKEEEIYPYSDNENLSPTEEAERQVFDILAVNIESYLPEFDKAEQQSRRFTFKLLSQAIQDNPDSVQKIISEVLGLKQEEQNDLAELLNNTELSSIISSAKTVANRLDLLTGLQNLLFDKESKKKLLERDQLHKILENEAWIFDEEFALSGSEERLEEVLQLHLGELGDREDSEPVTREGDKQGRVDLMLSRVIQPRQEERDHLVVELKRPSQKINSEVLTQAESYAIAVAKDPRFLTEKTRWRFIVVSNEFDEHAQRKARQRGKPPGLVFDDAELNIQVWARTWTEIISEAQTRLEFINSTLDYEATRETAKEYLSKAHAKFLPEIESEDE